MCSRGEECIFLEGEECLCSRGGGVHVFMCSRGEGCM